MAPDKRQLLRLGVLASGGGTNLQSILDRCDDGGLPAVVVVVVSNNSKAFALERARARGIATAHVSSRTHADGEERDEALVQLMRRYSVDWVVLAGYMKRIGPRLLETYRGRLVNIHPALLPLFGGAGMYGPRVHQAVYRSGMKVTGATVHLVDDEYDTGPILAQAPVILNGLETPVQIAERVLKVEHRLYPAVLRAVAEDRIREERGRFWIEGDLGLDFPDGTKHTQN